MSWYPNNNHFIPPLSLEQQQHHPQAAIYASDLEHQSFNSYHPMTHQIVNNPPMFLPVNQQTGTVYYGTDMAGQHTQLYDTCSSYPSQTAGLAEFHVAFQPKVGYADGSSDQYYPQYEDFNGYDERHYHPPHNEKQQVQQRGKQSGSRSRGNISGAKSYPANKNYSDFYSEPPNMNHDGINGNARGNRVSTRGNCRGGRGHRGSFHNNWDRRFDSGDSRNYESGQSRNSYHSNSNRQFQNDRRKYQNDIKGDRDSAKVTIAESEDVSLRKDLPTVSNSSNLSTDCTATVPNSKKKGDTANQRGSRFNQAEFNCSTVKGSFKDGREKSSKYYSKSRSDYADSGRQVTYAPKHEDYSHKGACSKPINKMDKDESQRGSLTEQLSRNSYECMVCCEIIKVDSAIWSCQNCYHVFHLYCTKKWARSSVDKDSNVWRCPGCQNESTQIPSQYRCYCGRRKDPAYVRGETPHSCGEHCRRKKKGNCQHPCTILCHPGPCPPCSSTVSQFCDCGKEKKSMRCSVAAPFKCDKRCAKDLPCGEHKCTGECHSGDCIPCTVSKTQRCYCEKNHRKVYCGKTEFKMISYCCENICGRTLSCGNHVCEEVCHPGECAPCSWDPKVLTTCCCGQTQLEQLESVERVTCLDPIPVCGKTCSKAMACGPQDNRHLCEKLCHEGECGPCDKETQVSCQCGRKIEDFPCETAIKYNVANPFKCQKRCGKKKNCGRHKCADNCCVKDFHICELTCGLKLSCGFHRCKELCHRGNCKRCLEASYEELSCFCGATVLEPPIACGTRPPECLQTCQRQQDCDHPVRHNCHMESKCPPCTELTEILCMGGHTKRKNIPCHMKNISCGMACNKPLSCGVHHCLKVCHKGSCLTGKEACSQPCSKPRKACGHPCGSVCHKGDCPPTFCKTEITVTCRCGNRSTKTACRMGGDQSGEIAQFQRLSVQTLADSGSEGVDMSQFCQTKPGSRKLDCDTSCALKERNKRIALALEIKNPDLDAKLGNASFTDYLKDVAKKNSKFATSVEEALGELVQTAKKAPQACRSHSFPSMNRDQRRFVHELAEFYGCQTQSFDVEPNKNVVVTAYRDKCWLPNVTLMQLVYKDHPSKPLSGLKTQGVKFTVLEKKKSPPSVKNVPAAPYRAWETIAPVKPVTPAKSSSATAKSASSSAAAAPSLDYFDFTEN